MRVMTSAATGAAVQPAVRRVSPAAKICGSSSDTISTYFGSEAGNTPANVAAYNAANDAANFHPRLPRYGRLTHDQERLGLTGSLQFRPSDSTLLSFDMLYSKFDATRQEDFLETISFSRANTLGGKYETNVREAVVDERGNLVYGVFDNVDVRSESRFDDLSTEFSQ